MEQWKGEKWKEENKMRVKNNENCVFKRKEERTIE